MKKFLSFNKAKKAVREHGIKTRDEYEKNRLLIPGLPSRDYVRTIYAGKFKGWRDFLGTKGEHRLYSYGTLDQVKEFIKENDIKSVYKYQKLIGGSSIKFPKNPMIIYGVTASSLFGDDRGKFNGKSPASQKMTLDELRKYIADLGIYSMDALVEYTCTHDDKKIPENIEGMYKDEFCGWDNFFFENPCDKNVLINEAIKKVEELSGLYETHIKALGELKTYLKQLKTK